MTSAAVIRLHAFVAATEEPILEAAAQRLSGLLAEGRDGGASVEAVFAASLGELDPGAPGVVAIGSLLPEVPAARADWAAAEARLMRRYRNLAARGAERLFLCTVFRHVPPELEEQERISLRVAIRRLDLLAVNISHATGLNVIDLDRALADIGAMPLETDYRLGGAAAVAAAGGVVASALLAAGIEDLPASADPVR